jgi:hypothetical protein
MTRVRWAVVAAITSSFAPTKAPAVPGTGVALLALLRGYRSMLIRAETGAPAPAVPGTGVALLALLLLLGSYFVLRSRQQNA